MTIKASQVFTELLDENEKLLKRYINFRKALAVKGGMGKLSGTQWFVQLEDTITALAEMSNELKAEADRMDLMDSYLASISPPPPPRVHTPPPVAASPVRQETNR